MIHAWVDYLTLFLLAWVICWALTPLAGELARKLGCVDRPWGRKVHTRNVPYFGGAAIYISFLVVMVYAYFSFPQQTPEMTKLLPGLLLGGTVIFVTGLIDDIKTIRPVVKLAGQSLAGLALALSGLRIEVVTNPLGGEIQLNAVIGIILTVVWVVCMVNAINLIDGLDGLAAGVTAIASLTLFIVAVRRSDVIDMIMTLILLGSCLGFLRYNFFPARIFLGDAGSMFIGFVLAVMGLQGVQKSATVMALLIPISALAVPVLDALMAVVRRSKVKKNIFTADHEHLHHRLVRLGIRERNVVLLIYFFCIHLGITAFVITLIPVEYTLIILALIAMGILFGITTLGFIEEKMAIRMRQSEQESMIDAETGLCSFRYFTRRVIDEIKSNERYDNRGFSLLVFELKGLKDSIDRLHSGVKKTEQFRAIARFFQENVRTSDVVTYLGGENFVIMTPEQAEGKDYLIERLKTIFENFQADQKNQELIQWVDLKIRAVDYPGNKGLVQELLRDAVEVS